MLQIIGTNKCRSTQKAIRWCKERKIEFQYIDLNEKKLSKKEYESIFSSCSADEYIDNEYQEMLDAGYDDYNNFISGL